MAIDQPMWAQMVAELERRIGPTQRTGDTTTAFEGLQGVYRGERVHVIWHSRHLPGHPTHPDGHEVRVDVSLGNRPIRTWVRWRGETNLSGPTASTDDPGFDARYVAAATPAEVVSRALDPEVRAMIERRWPGEDTSLIASDGSVSIRLACSQHSETHVPTGRQVEQTLDDLLLFATRLKAAYDARRSEIASANGEQAALDWEAKARAAQHRRGPGLAVLGVLLGALVLAVLVIVGCAGWMAMVR